MMPWRVLFGVLTAAVSIYNLAHLVADHFLLIRPPPDYFDMIVGGISIVGLVLTYPLIRGHNWARMTLVSILGCFVVLWVVRVPYAFFTTEFEYARIVDFLTAVLCLLIAVLVMLALVHPDVRRDFEHR
jgi:hypothetical protein